MTLGINNAPVARELTVYGTDKHSGVVDFTPSLSCGDPAVVHFDRFRVSPATVRVRSRVLSSMRNTQMTPIEGATVCAYVSLALSTSAATTTPTPTATTGSPTSSSVTATTRHSKSRSVHCPDFFWSSRLLGSQGPDQGPGCPTVEVLANQPPAEAGNIYLLHKRYATVTGVVRDQANERSHRWCVGPYARRCLLDATTDPLGAVHPPEQSPLDYRNEPRMSRSIVVFNADGYWLPKTVTGDCQRRQHP